VIPGFDFVVLLILCAATIIHYKGYTPCNQQLKDASVVANWTLFRDYRLIQRSRSQLQLRQISQSNQNSPLSVVIDTTITKS